MFVRGSPSLLRDPVISLIQKKSGYLYESHAGWMEEAIVGERDTSSAELFCRNRSQMNK